MRTVNINQISVWSDGVNVPVTILGVEIAQDNLTNWANFKYALYQNYDPNNSSMNIPVTSGYIAIDGQDYEDWGDSADINLAAIEWVADQLNLTIN